VLGSLKTTCLVNWKSFLGWAGDEGPALEALITLFNEQNPNVEVINATVTGGSGVNARAVLKTRMLGGDAPDSFQVHAGEELTGTWVVAGRMADLTTLYQEQGWMEAFPADLLDLLTYEGGIYSVPVNIHRSNVMWFNPATVESLGIAVPATMDEFLAACPAIQEAGITPSLWAKHGPLTTCGKALHSAYWVQKVGTAFGLVKPILLAQKWCKSLKPSDKFLHVATSRKMQLVCAWQQAIEQGCSR
jgi:ABC-type glycerol-3-phosphate transport system substrate-binding protein